MMPGLEGNISHDTSPPPTRALMSDGDDEAGVREIVKRFVFRSRRTQSCAQGDEREESLEILIPEVSGATPRARVARMPAGVFPARASYRCYVIFLG